MHSPARDVFDARGSLYREGRWHSLGTLVVYAAEHISLAALEILVHAEGTKIPPRVVTEILVPDPATLEETPWLELPDSRAFGDRWVQEQRSLLLRVPSIAADKLEHNFVINPKHADFAMLKQGTSRAFHFDERFVHFP